MEQHYDVSHQQKQQSFMYASDPNRPNIYVNTTTSGRSVPLSMWSASGPHDELVFAPLDGTSADATAYPFSRSDTSVSVTSLESLSPPRGQTPSPPLLRTSPSKASAGRSPGVGAFVHKLYNLLLDEQNWPYARFSTDGLSFTVFNPSMFATAIIPKHFKHSNFSSFVRQLNMYGFHKVSRSTRSANARDKADDQPCEFTHPAFRRGHPELIDTISRRKGLDSSDLGYGESGSSGGSRYGDMTASANTPLATSPPVQGLVRRPPHLAQLSQSALFAPAMYSQSPPNEKPNILSPPMIQTQPLDLNAQASLAAPLGGLQLMGVEPVGATYYQVDARGMITESRPQLTTAQIAGAQLTGGQVTGDNLPRLTGPSDNRALATSELIRLVAEQFAQQSGRPLCLDRQSLALLRDLTPVGHVDQLLEQQLLGVEN